MINLDDTTINNIKNLVDEYESEEDAIKRTYGELQTELDIIRIGNFDYETRTKLIKELNEKYGDYIGFLIDEKAEYEEIIELQKELINRLNKGIDINKLLIELLQKHDTEILKEKEKLSREAKPTKSKYIKVGIRKVLQKEHGTKCSIRGCKEDAKVIHHTQRFSISKTHSPKYLAPLCKEHHQIAHTVDSKFHEARAG